MKYNSVRNEQLMRSIAVESLSWDYIYPSQGFCGKLGGGGLGGEERKPILE